MLGRRRNVAPGLYNIRRMSESPIPRRNLSHNRNASRAHIDMNTSSAIAATTSDPNAGALSTAGVPDIDGSTMPQPATNPNSVSSPSSNDNVADTPNSQLDATNDVSQTTVNLAVDDTITNQNFGTPSEAASATLHNSNGSAISNDLISEGIITI